MSESYASEILAYLRDYRLKPTGRDRYTCNSPLRAGSDSGAFALAIDPEVGGGGKWYDFVAGEGGNFLTLARQLGIAQDEAPGSAAPTTKRSYADLADYARAHGVDANVFSAAGWRSGEWFDKQAGRRRPALLFETASGTRARFIDGLSPTYMHKAGFQRCWYGLQRAAAMDGPIVFCNGEASAVVASAFGVPAVTLAGGGEKPIPTALLMELAAAVPPGSREILVALDADTTGRRAARQIVAQLREACYTARAVAFDGHPGFDLADFCHLHQAGALAALTTLPDLPDEPPLVEGGPAAEVVATQQTVIQQLQKAVDEMRRRMQWLTDLLARKDLKLGARAAIRSMVLEMDRVPVEEQTDGRFYEVRAWKIAEENGTTTGTISRALDRLTELGYIEKQKITSYDPEEQRTRATIYIRPLVNLRALDEVPPLPKENRRARPRCATCGSPNLSSFAYVCENGHLTTAEEAARAEVDEEACLQNANTVLDAEPPGIEPEPCLQNAITLPTDELRPVESEPIPFFDPRDCIEPVLKNEVNPSPLTDRDPPRVQNANTPPDYPPGYVLSLIDRLRNRIATQQRSPQPGGA